MTTTPIIKTLSVRVRDKHAKQLRQWAFEVNQVWNEANAEAADLSWVGIPEVGFMNLGTSEFDLNNSLVGIRRERRLTFKVWDSYGLAGYELGTGCFSEDARGRWYFNTTVKVTASAGKGTGAIGIDLGLKTTATCSDGTVLNRQDCYRNSESALGKAQRAKNKWRVKAIHAKIKNQRKDAIHKFTSKIVSENSLIIVGNVSASGLAKTKLAKSVLDAGWFMLKAQIAYNVLQPFLYPRCLDSDRDINAARNILALGHKRLAVGIPDLKGREDVKNQFVDVQAHEGQGERINQLWRQAGLGRFLIYTDTVIQQEIKFIKIDNPPLCSITAWNHALPLYAKDKGRVFFLNRDEFSEHFQSDTLSHQARIDWMMEHQSLFKSMIGLPDAINALYRITLYHQEQTFKELPIQPQSKVFQYCYRFDCPQLWRDYLNFRQHPSTTTWLTLSAHKLPISGQSGIVWRDTVQSKYDRLMNRLVLHNQQSAYPTLFEVDKLFQQTIFEAGKTIDFTPDDSTLFYHNASIRRVTDE